MNLKMASIHSLMNKKRISLIPNEPKMDPGEVKGAGKSLDGHIDQIRK